MRILRALVAIVPAAAALFAAVLPQLGRDTVLVWTVVNQDDASRFVVRIAEFQPSRYVEWENAVTQGTILIPSKAVENARGFVNARLFEGGVDTRGKDATTLWLSRWAYRELVSNGRVKLAIDSVAGVMTLEAKETMTIEVNRVPTEITVLRVHDDRGQGRCFIDSEDNPLLARHSFRSFTQTLKSITTDRPNTLRWIKGRKLTTPD